MKQIPAMHPVIQQIAKRSLICLTLLLSALPGWTMEETPANLNDKDTGNLLPVSLFRGHISNQSSRYILGPGDAVSIKIKDLDQFNQKTSIRPDGYITVHPLGEVYIAGTDIQGFQSWLEQQFKTYLIKPQITVDVEDMRPALVYITGAVQRPGTYQFARQKQQSSPGGQERVEMTLSNVLVRAGGVRLKSDISNISVVHASTGQKETFNLLEFLKDDNGGKDIYLLPEDKIHIPELSQSMDPDTFRLVSSSTFFREKFPVVVLGAVSKQGEVLIDPTNNGLDAAIGLAGGFVSGLSKRDRLIVQRPGNNGGFNRWVINRQKSNLELMPGDIVYVPDSKVAWMERGLRFLNGIAQPYYFSVNGSNVIKNGLFQSGN